MAGQNHYPTSNCLTIVPPYGDPEDQPPIDPQSNTWHHQSSSNLPPPPPPPSATIASPTSGRHPVYRGIRCRGGKWVSEIREPKKSSRIWLGTYQTPEMAAAAYDVAALALKGPDAAINFPDWAPYYQVPYSHSASDIRAAAASAAAARAPPNSGHQIVAMPQADQASSSEFVDEEALFDMPNLLVDMAGGMLVSPPRMTSAAEDEEDNYSRNDNLWSYD